MTSLQTVQKEIRKIREKTTFKSRKVIVVHMWQPGDKDPPYDGGPIRVKALKEESE